MLANVQAPMPNSPDPSSTGVTTAESANLESSSSAGTAGGSGLPVGCQWPTLSSSSSLARHRQLPVTPVRVGGAASLRSRQTGWQLMQVHSTWVSGRAQAAAGPCGVPVFASYLVQDTRAADRVHTIFSRVLAGG